MDLTKKRLQDTVLVGGKDYGIKTGFRQWILFSRLVRERAPLSEFDWLYEQGDDLRPIVPEDREKGFEALLGFYSPKEELPRPTGSDGGAILWDYDLDSSLIFAAFLHYYRIRLTQADLHWHEFLAMFRGLKDTKLNDVIGWRAFEPSGEKGMEKWNSKMNELKRSWEIRRVSAEDKAALEAFNARFD